MFSFGIDKKPPYKITKPIRLIETFSGVGTQAMALRDLNVPFESYRSYEIAKPSVDSYNAIFGTNYQPIDIKSISGKDLGIIERDKYEYILTYSFPCTDLSLSGKREGMSRNSGTRSGLLWEVERLLKESPELPQILVMENVTQVHNPKNINDFNEWLNFLKPLGYSNFYQDLNGKDFGIPQSRNRCFMVSILGDYSYEFPKPIPLTKSVFDLVEKSVPESYDLGSELQKQLIQNLKDRGDLTDKILSITPTYSIDLTKSETSYVVGAQRGRDIYNPTYRGRKDDRKYQQRLELNNLGICNALTTVGKDNQIVEISNGHLRIRRMTPLECWRFMGFSDEDYFKAAAKVSPTNLCKQAGNAIVKQVLMAVFRNLF